MTKSRKEEGKREKKEKREREREQGGVFGCFDLVSLSHPPRFASLLLVARELKPAGVSRLR